MNLGVKFPLPKPEVPVDKRELTVVCNGQSRVFVLPGSALLSDEIVFGEHDNYSATLVDIDAHGNRSLPSEPLHGSVIDEIRPPRPGALGPTKPENKRVLTDEEAARVKEESIKKIAEQTKAEQAKEAKAKSEMDAKKLSPPFPPAPLK